VRSITRTILVLTLIGCASAAPMYGGPRLSENEAVRIDGTSSIESLGYAASVCNLDDIELDPCKTDIEIKPGEHKLKIQTTYFGTFQAEKWVRINFKPGDRYLLGLKFVYNSSIRYPEIWRKGNVNDF